MIEIREETAADHEAIAAVNRAAFGGEDEVRLVAKLRTDGDALTSLVAEDAGQIVGHILFSRLAVTTGTRSIRAAALAPLAVVPKRQRQGIGAALTGAGIEACRARGLALIVVMGHPEYYPRFGFSAEAAKALRAPFEGEAFMALELVPGTLQGETATCRYAPAFGLDEAASG